jgi:hypothetical protein
MGNYAADHTQDRWEAGRTRLEKQRLTARRYMDLSMAEAGEVLASDVVAELDEPVA